MKNKSDVERSCVLVPVFNSVILLSCLCYVHILNNSCMIPVREYVLFRIA